MGGGPISRKIALRNTWMAPILLNIYTTKIDGVVCPPNISETVAGRLMKLAHRQRIASTTIKLISKKIYCPFYKFYLKYFQRVVAYPKRKLSPPFYSADSVPSLGHPGSGKMLSLFALRIPNWCGWPRPEPRVRVKQFSQSEFSSTTAVRRTIAYALLHIPLGQVPKLFTVPSHTLGTSLL